MYDKLKYFILIFLIYMFAKIKTNTKYDTLIKEISKDFGNNPALIKALIHVESSFNERAHNLSAHENSIGLGQINEPTAKALGIKNIDDLYDPAFNIQTMNKLLDDLKSRYDSIFEIISAYNVGSLKYRNGKFINSGYVFSVFSKYVMYSIIGV